jgi:hypothetical protein
VSSRVEPSITDDLPELAEVAGVDGKRDVFEAARVEAARLHTDCDILNMKRHQSEHPYLISRQCTVFVTRATFS